MTGVLLLLLFLVGANLRNSIRLLITGERSRGVVVGMATSPGTSDQDPSQSPIVEFVASTGEKNRVSSRTFANSPSARVGEAVTVAYDPSNPSDGQLLLWRSLTKPVSRLKINEQTNGKANLEKLEAMILS